MMEPFAKCLATSNDYRLKKEVYQHVFTYLIKQSDEALEYEARGLEKEAIVSMSDAKAKRKKARKNRKNGTVEVEEEPEKENQDEGNEEKMEEDEEAEADEEEADGDGEDEMEMEESNYDWGAKDPRAGGVDVVLPQITPDYNQLAEMLFQVASDKKVRAKNRKALYDLIKKWVDESCIFCISKLFIVLFSIRFRDLANGIYPLAVDLPTVGPGLTPRYMKSAAKQYIKDELGMTELRNAEKKEMKDFLKKNNLHRTSDAEDIDEALMKDLDADGVIFEREEEIYEDGDLADLEDEGEEEDDTIDEEEDDSIDEENEGTDEDADEEEELDSSDEDELTDDDSLVSEEEEVVKCIKKSKKVPLFCANWVF